MNRLAVLPLLLAAAVALAEPPPPPAVRNVEIDERLGAPVPEGLPFVDAAGRAVRLGDYFRPGRPVILTLVYDRCPMLCSLLLRDLARGLRELAWRPGKDFEVVTVSVDPAEKPALAAQKQGGYLQALGDPGDAAAWPFLTGPPSSTAALARALGFRYSYDPITKSWAHGALLFLLSPAGKISRYLYGVDFPASTLRLALSEAGARKVVASIDRILLTCYHYDPASRRYGLAIFAALRAGGLLVLGLLGILIGRLAIRERRRG